MRKRDLIKMRMQVAKSEKRREESSQSVMSRRVLGVPSWPGFVAESANL